MSRKHKQKMNSMKNDELTSNVKPEENKPVEPVIVKPENKVMPISKPEVKPEVKTEVKPEVKPEVKTEPTLTVKPAEPAVKPAPAAEPVKPVVKNKSKTNLDKLKTLTDKFLEEMAVRRTTVGDPSHKAMMAYINIFNFIDRCNDPAVYRQFLAFTIANRNGVCSISGGALLGIHTVRDSLLRERVLLFFNVYMQLARYRTERKRPGISIGALRAMYKNGAFVDWVSEQLVQQRTLQN